MAARTLRVSAAFGSARRSGSRPANFFLQAEDAIRAAAVTGVQTCALPISSTTWTPPVVTSSRRILRVEADVGGSEVGGAHRPPRSGAAQVQPQLDLAGGKGRAGVGTGRRAVAHQHHPLGRVLPGDPIHG